MSLSLHVGTSFLVSIQNMSSKKRMSKRTRASLQRHSAQLGPDDCIDPRDYFKTNSNRQKANRKTQQLCRQVHRTLELVLGDCDDESLLSAFIVDVKPAPDSSRLLVTVCIDQPKPTVCHAQMMQRLIAQTSRLRHEISQSIHRKKVPSLVFQIAMPPNSLDHKETGSE